MTSHDRFRIAALLLAIVVLPAITWSQSQNRDPNISSESALDRWIDWKPFLGTWEGTGTGEPGQSELNFTFEKELQGFVLTCHSYAEYPASKDKPAHRHDDLMVIYPSPSGKNTRADYWGNEGHVIHYDVNLSLGKLVFLSDVNQPGPRFRLTYLIDTREDKLKMTFEVAAPNDRDNFKQYIEASARRKPAASLRPGSENSDLGISRLRYVAIVVRDYDEALNWYTKVLGLEKTEEGAFGKDNRWIVVAPRGRKDIGIILEIARAYSTGSKRPKKPEVRLNSPQDPIRNYEARVGKETRWVFEVGDCRKFYEAASKRGVKFIETPVEQAAWGVTEAMFEDLYGNVFVVQSSQPKPGRELNY